MRAPDDHLRVNDDEAGEKRRRDPGIERHEGLGTEPDHQDAEEDEGPGDADQDAEHWSEVPLGSERKQKKEALMLKYINRSRKQDYRQLGLTGKQRS
jgi:hypothetical protein